MFKIKLITYNIADCRHSSGEIIDIARTIEEEQADIVAMQEVDQV